MNTDEQILKYLETELCPVCTSYVEVESMHERDSSNDTHTCLSCGWRVGQMSIWRVEEEVRDEARSRRP